VTRNPVTRSKPSAKGSAAKGYGQENKQYKPHFSLYHVDHPII
jgi:hypothetical protein